MEIDGPAPAFGSRPEDIASSPGHVSSIVVLLDANLRSTLGIGRTTCIDTSTVKIAGNPSDRPTAEHIKSLVRTYGAKVKIVAMADDSGCAEDSDCLDHKELLRLIGNKPSIAIFDASKLSGDCAAVSSADTAKGAIMPRVEADVFIPLGGPNSAIGIHTCKTWAKKNGKSSTKVIVEGGNTFVTAEARQKLKEDAGIVVLREITPLVSTLDAQLRTTMHIDPANQSFSVKLTGGPSDEGAAKEIKILIREYGDKVQFVGIADESGCVEDPNGIDHQELLRLVGAGKTISDFDKTKLSGKVKHISQLQQMVSRPGIPCPIVSSPTSTYPLATFRPHPLM